MTVENFRKACEYMKEEKQKDLIEATLRNLEKARDEERLKAFKEIFSTKEKDKKNKE